MSKLFTLHVTWNGALLMALYKSDYRKQYYETGMARVSCQKTAG